MEYKYPNLLRVKIVSVPTKYCILEAYSNPSVQVLGKAATRIAQG